MTNLVEVVVAGPRPFFNGSLFYPGETTVIDLDDYATGKDSEGKDTDLNPAIGKGNLSNLALPGEAKGVTPVLIAPIAPHAPNPTAAQGFPPGGKVSGSGRVIHPDGQGGSFEAVPADGSESDEAAAARREQRDGAVEAAASFNADALDHDGDGKKGGSKTKKAE